MSALVEAVVPVRLGRSFRWLLASSWTSQLGDGIALAAGPLLVASQTSNPTLVASAALLQRLPWLLFALYAGVLADRLDRRRLVVVADGLRVVVLVALVTTLLTGTVSIAVVLAAMFALGTAEVFADTATSALLPMVVAKRDLGVGNARLMGGFLVLNQLVGAPLGAALFAAGRHWPFLTQAVCVALGVVLVSRVRLPAHGTAGEPRHIAAEVREGWRWVWHHRPVRTLALTIFTFNVTWGCAWSVLVLYSRERLGLGEVGFGLITTVIAVGGIAGTLSYGRLERRVPLAGVMRGVLLTETLVHLVLALTSSVPVAMVAFLAFGVEAFVWGTTASSVRQRAVPTQVQGRVGSVYMVGLQGGLVIGALLAGPLAHVWGITAPFWFAFAGSALFLALIWRELGHVAHADEETLAAEASG
ncbi:MFS transporter [Nocardioides mangrovicus]|uniref:MFS transporter n=1 Tax=Nocardioides mangrovicus TaxID=2478913 RepID=A0A3L8P6V9_9ACTN|nr:MFS transporter [Nocardioides mangrovicus]RLV51170.1 MFS transporter [Nocardioides mangrovicus]